MSTVFSAVALIGDTAQKSIQLKSNRTKSKVGFCGEGKPEYPEKNLSVQIREPTNSTHIRHRVHRAPVAQLVEHRAVTREVVSPAGPTLTEEKVLPLFTSANS